MPQVWNDVTPISDSSLWGIEWHMIAIEMSGIEKKVSGDRLQQGNFLKTIHNFTSKMLYLDISVLIMLEL